MSRSDGVTLPGSMRRVLVVDDSAFMRRMVSELVASTGEFVVVGTARDGHDALRQVHALDPDIVTLDVEMPGLDGLDVLGYIMSELPRPVVMLSAGGANGGAELTLRALELGAVDFVRKPSGPISLDVERVGDDLLDALRAAACTNLRGVHVLARSSRAEGAIPVVARSPRVPERVQHVVCIAASTGGPAALTQILPRLPRDLHAAVLVVQHMPKGFTASFAARLNTLARVVVSEACDGEALRNGHVYIAPAGSHLRVCRDAHDCRLVLGNEPAQWGVRPAADPLFTSAAQTFGASVAGVVLTGMGRDGAEGLRAVRKAGGIGLVQNVDSAVIAAMPLAALAHAGADRVVALNEVAAAIVAAVSELDRRRCLSTAQPSEAI